MKTFTRINAVNLKKLNNAEFINFSQRFLKLIYKAKEGDTPATGAALGMDPADVVKFEEDLSIMSDIVSYSRASDLTAEMAKEEKVRNDLVSYIITIVRISRISPEDSHKAASISLFKVIKPYIGCQRLPNQQSMVAINGLIIDLNKPENASRMRVLSLSDSLVALKLHNDNYINMVSERNEQLKIAQLEDSKVVRQRMCDLYDCMVNFAYAHSLSHPSELTAEFVLKLNGLIEEINALYNMRQAQSKRKPAKE